MSLTHDADGVGPDLELMLRSELGAVADAIGTTAGPVPVRAVAARFRAARRRRRAAGAAGVALGMVATFVLVVSVAPGSGRADDPAPATRTPTSRPSTATPSPSAAATAPRSRTPIAVSPGSRRIMSWVGDLPVKGDAPEPDIDRRLTPVVDAAGDPRAVSPDGARYATRQTFGDPAGAGTGHYELQIRRSSDDRVEKKLFSGQDSTPVAWLGGRPVVMEPGSSSGWIPFVWETGKPALTRVGGIANYEDTTQMVGDRLFLVRFLESQRCAPPDLDARVVRLVGVQIQKVWEGCSRDGFSPLSPDGRFVVDARAWFTTVDLQTGSARTRGTGGTSTKGWDQVRALTWDAQSRWYQVTMSQPVPGGTEAVTYVRCTVSDGRCVRLTGTA